MCLKGVCPSSLPQCGLRKWQCQKVGLICKVVITTLYVYQISQLYYKKAFMEIEYICMYILVVIVTYMTLYLVVVIFQRNEVVFQNRKIQCKLSNQNWSLCVKYKLKHTKEPWFSDHRFSDKLRFSGTFQEDQSFSTYIDLVTNLQILVFWFSET